MSTKTTHQKPSLLRKLLKNPVGLGALIFLGTVVLLSILAPLLTHFNPNEPDIMKVLAGPGGGHILGTDSAGRDNLARLLFGARTTLIAAALVSITAIVVGVPAGLIAGYYGGFFDLAANWVANMFMSLPALIVLLAARATLGPSIF